jgi:hypothetical protein
MQSRFMNVAAPDALAKRLVAKTGARVGGAL